MDVQDIRAASVVRLEGWSLDAGWTVAVQADLTQAGAGELLRISDGGPADVLCLRVRLAGQDAALARLDGLQNYARYPRPDGTCPVLEALVRTAVPRELLAKQAQDHAARREKDPSLPPFRADPFTEAGTMVLGVPLTLLGAGEHQVTVRVTAGIVDLLVDGVRVDREWPMGLATLARTAEMRRGGGVREAQARGRALRDEEIVAAAGGPEAVARRAREILGPPRPMRQYWTPAGHNHLAGDPMLLADGDRLHLFWLTAPRMGACKWGAGAAEFAHHSTTDLMHWEEHPLAMPITEPWEATMGTGTVVRHAGEYHLFTFIVTERLGLETQHPAGTYRAVSRDGVHFEKQGYTGFRGEPGMVQDAEGVWHAIVARPDADGVWRCARMESRDLRQWRVADPDLLEGLGWPYSRSVFSSECFNWFAWNGWQYLLGGRTGFWRARDVRGPFRSATHGPHDAALSPKWDIYDGLIVPQVAVWRGRAILAGWLAYPMEWAGHLVFRELFQRRDGNLEMRRLPELEPPEGQTLPVEGPGGEDMPLNGHDGLAWAEFSHGGRDVRLRVLLEAAGTTGRFGLRLGGTPGDAEGVELRFEPVERLAQWGTPRAGALAERPVGMPCDGRDFAILEVEGLAGPVELDVIVRREDKRGTTIVDAAINGRRTMVTRRERFTPGRGAVFVDGGTLRVSKLRVEELA